MHDKFNFTKASLDALPTPDPGQRVVYHDAKARGLQVRVTSNGVKTFSVRRRTKVGSIERVTLGRYPEMSIEQARRQTAEINAAIEGGANPAQVKRAHKGEMNFSELFKQYLERHAKVRKRTWKEDDQRYKQYLQKPLGMRKLSAIDRQTIATLHSKITRDGHPTVANRMLALVSSVYGRGIEWGLVEHNPARGIRRNPEKSRDRFLQSNELPRFFMALAEEPNTTIRDYLMLSLLTGARRSNVLAMRWNDVSLDEAVWRIPDTKNGTPQNVPLLSEAIEILKERYAENERDKKTRSAFVFPGHGNSGHLVEPKKGWQRIFDRDELRHLTQLIQGAGHKFEPKKDSEGNINEGLHTTLSRARCLAEHLKINQSGIRITNVRIHDLRRTLGSWQAKTGASLSIIGKSLNHKNIQTTAIYARLDLDPVRESVERATSAMFVAAGLKQPSESTTSK